MRNSADASRGGCGEELNRKLGARMATATAERREWPEEWGEGVVRGEGARAGDGAEADYRTKIAKSTCGRATSGPQVLLHTELPQPLLLTQLSPKPIGPG